MLVVPYGGDIHSHGSRPTCRVRPVFAAKLLFDTRPGRFWWNGSDDDGLLRAIGQRVVRCWRRSVIPRPYPDSTIQSDIHLESWKPVVSVIIARAR